MMRPCVTFGLHPPACPGVLTDFTFILVLVPESQHDTFSSETRHGSRAGAFHVGCSVVCSKHGCRID
eukprot:scaffold257808_cov32-Prasinocladus_malaysianus.AAC.1